MKYIQGVPTCLLTGREDRGYYSQKPLMITFLPDGREEENPVQFIDAFVDNLDLEGLGFKHAKLKSIGRSPYNPADLLKLYIYGYLNRIRSSRCLEKECKRNIELMWLLKKLAPDFKTIADFRKDNKEAIKKVCLSADRQAGILSYFVRSLIFLVENLWP